MVVPQYQALGNADREEHSVPFSVVFGGLEAQGGHAVAVVRYSRHGGRRIDQRDVGPNSITCVNVRTVAVGERGESCQSVMQAAIAYNGYWR